MPPKRMMEDVHDGGEAVDEEEIIQQIKIVIRENSMCEICSCILKSAGALTRHKREVHQCEEFMCQTSKDISRFAEVKAMRLRLSPYYIAMKVTTKQQRDTI